MVENDRPQHKYFSRYRRHVWYVWGVYNAQYLNVQCWSDWGDQAAGHGSQPSPQLLVPVGLHDPCQSLSAIDIPLRSPCDLRATAADLNMKQSFVSYLSG
jgi:hypothetical protein